MNRKEEVLELRQRLIVAAERLKNSISKVETEINLMRQENPADEGDYAVLNNDTYIDDALIAKQFRKLKEIERALDKITEGNYGICEMCEEEIDIERLKVKPFAKFCISCREIIEQERKI